MKLLNRPARRHSGFTLLEVLVAIAVFSILSAAGYQVLQGVVNSNEISIDSSSRLRELQRAMLFMERDFSQMAARLVRTNGEVNSSLLQTGEYVAGSEGQGISFVRNGWRNPQALFKRSALQSVAYIVQGEDLIKRYYVHTDTVSGAEPKELVLLEGVESMQFRFFNEGKWGEGWNSADSLPKGVEVTLSLTDIGEIRRVFLSSTGKATAVSEGAQEDDDDDSSDSDESDESDSDSDESESEETSS